MASSTPRFGLRKPAGTDFVSVLTDISENMDKIDAIQDTVGNGVNWSLADLNGITAETQVPDMAITVTTFAGRRYVLTFSHNMETSDGQTKGLIRIKEGGTTLRAGNFHPAKPDETEVVHLEALITPTAGVHTYNVTVARVSGTGTISMKAINLGSLMILKDVGWSGA